MKKKKQKSTKPQKNKLSGFEILIGYNPDWTPRTVWEPIKFEVPPGDPPLIPKKGRPFKEQIDEGA